MPTLSATSSAVFSDVGLDPSDVYETFTALIGTAVDFGLWLVQVAWPFYLTIGFIYLVYHLARKFTGLGR